ncbi:MAG: GntR family transcriptional regulator [Chthoniobacteraceae bacterium]
MLNPDFQANLESAIPVYQQIENRFRAAIEEGAWPYGSKLPTLRDLADQFQTSIFTIQTAMDALVKDRMIESRRGRGTFVTASSARLSSVGIYFGRNFLQGRETAFYQELYRILAGTLDSRRIKHEFWLDTRSEAKHCEPLADLQKAVSQRTLQGLIVGVTNREELPWLTKLGVPLAVCGSAPVPYSVEWDFVQMMRLALGDLKRQGCGSVGVVLPVPASFSGSLEAKAPEGIHLLLQSFLKVVQEYQLETRDAWVRIPEGQISTRDHEEYGYQQFQELWKQAERPDGLLVYPDTVVRGCVTAILQERLSVPGDLKLVLHRNEGIPVSCPFPASWLVSEVGLMASSLISQVDLQLAGKAVSPIFCSCSLETTEP